MSSPRLAIPRYDQSPVRSLFSDEHDYSELLTIVSSSPSSTEVSLNADADNDYRTVEGSARLFSAQNTLYMLPLDEQEFRRLDKQHTIMRIGFLGLYPAKQLVESILQSGASHEKAILDIGCGTGQWASEMAEKYDQASVVAIDIIDPRDRDAGGSLPDRVQFERYDVNNGLAPYYGRYDVVHSRCIASGVMQYREFIHEARKCLKPGGIAIFIEGDFDLFAEDQVSILEPASEENPNGSWMQRWMQAVRMAQIRRCKLENSDDTPELLDKGLWQFEGFNRNLCGAASVFTPTTPWISSRQDEEALHFKIAGVLMRQNLKLFILSTEQMLVEDGMDREQVDHWMLKIQEEIEGEGKFKAWYHWRVAWATAPRANVAPPPPVSSPSYMANTVIPTIIRPMMVLGSKSKMIRKQLIDLVEHFKIQQSYVYTNEKDALANVERRMKTPFNTRGKF